LALLVRIGIRFENKLWSESDIRVSQSRGFSITRFISDESASVLAKVPVVPTPEKRFCRLTNIVQALGLRAVLKVTALPVQAQFYSLPKRLQSSEPDLLFAFHNAEIAFRIDPAPPELTRSARVSHECLGARIRS
jgi:hypothetical protein